MKKLTAILICSIIISYSLLHSSCQQNKASAKTSIADAVGLRSTEDLSIQRGKYLAWHVADCMGCHSQRDFSRFAGPVKPGTEGMGGDIFGPQNGLPYLVYARNITPAALGNWTDQEILRAMTTGISKNGDTLLPVMPYMAFSQMAQKDLMDIISYIRTLKPLKNSIPERKLYKPITELVPNPMPHPDLGKNPKPDPKDQVKYGQFLVNIASCNACHTPREGGKFLPAKYLGGGTKYKKETFEVFAANITPDTSGIGLWTEKMFIEKFRANAHEDYVNRKPGKYNTVMPWPMFGKMKEEDLKAIYAYLRTLKPVRGHVYPWGNS